MIYLAGLNAFEPNAFRDALRNLFADGDPSRVPLLLDTRSSQYSRTEPFRGNLDSFLPANAAYRWDPRLGGHPNDGRLYREDGRIDYRQLRAAPFFREAMQELLDAESQGRDVVVICACRDAHTCHRMRAVAADLAVRGIDAIEIGSGMERKSALTILDGIPADRRELSERPIPGKQRHAVPREVPAEILVAPKTQRSEDVLQERLDTALAQAATSSRPRREIVVAPVTDNDIAKIIVEALGATVVLDARRDPQAPGGVHLPLSQNPALRLSTLAHYANRHSANHAAVILCDSVGGDTPYANAIRIGSALNQVGQDVRYLTRADDFTAPRLTHENAYHAVVKGLEQQQTAVTRADSVRTPKDIEAQQKEQLAVTWARSASRRGERPSSSVELQSFSDDMRTAFAQAAQDAPEFAKDPAIYQENASAVLFRAADEHGPLINMFNHAPLQVPVSDNSGQQTTVAVQSSEALFQALFYSDLPKFQQYILRASHAMESKQRAYVPPDQRPGEERAKDHTMAKAEEDRVGFRKANRVEIMRYVLELKAAQNRDVRDALLATGNAPIVEKSIRDPFWGAVPANGQLIGHNVLGNLWMDIRERLRENPNALNGIVPPQTDPTLKLLGKTLTSLRLQEREGQEQAPGGKYTSPIREVMTWAGVGESEREAGRGPTPEEAAFGRQIGARMYRANYTLLSGLATGADYNFTAGVVDQIKLDAGDDRARFEALAARHVVSYIGTEGGYAKRAESLHVPYYVIDPNNEAHKWAYADAMKVHPRGHKLGQGEKGFFTLQAHGRNMMIIKSEDGKHPVEFVAYIASLGPDGLPDGGTRTGVAAAHNEAGITFQRPENRIPTFNIRDPHEREMLDQYVSAIERGDIRFGDGRAGDKRYIYPRDGFVGSGMQFDSQNALPDLSYSILNNATFDGITTDTSFHRAYANQATISNCTLSGDIKYVYARRATLDTVALTEAASAQGITLQDAALSSCNFAADMRGGDFSRSTIENSVLAGDLRGCKFDGATLDGTHIGADHVPADHVRNLDFTKTQLNSVTWSQPILERGADALGLRLSAEQREDFNRQAERAKTLEQQQQKSQELVHAE